MTSLTVLPPFTGETYDDLLADVAARIEEEPARLDMRWWVLLKDGKRPPGTPESICAISKPACGTVACLGGWMDLRSGLPLHSRLSAGRDLVGKIRRTRWHGLFEPHVFDEDFEIVHVSASNYVSLALLRIAEFRATHAESLKTPLPKPEVKA